MTLEAYPGGPNYPPLKRPIIDRDFLATEYAKDPQGAAVEFGAQWARTIASYLREANVRRMFGKYQGKDLIEKQSGVFAYEYYAHGDPALTGDNFAFVIAHGEEDESSRVHVVVDRIQVWSPADFDDGEIDHTQVEEDVKELIPRFSMVEMSFDHWNSALVRQRLQKFANAAHLARRLHVREEQPNAGSNRSNWEIFKNALAEDRIHSYPHELAELELLFLQRKDKKVEAPTTGPCTTDDVATAIMNVAVRILTRQDPGGELAKLQPRGSNPFGPGSPSDQDTFNALSGFGKGRRFQPGAPRMRRGDRPPGTPRR